jgi:magnesium-transporting ATPase (P-type)
VIPFESENKFMATLDRIPDGGARILLKGAPDRLLDRCPAPAGGRWLQRGARPRLLGATDRSVERRRACACSPPPRRDADAGRKDLTLDDLEQDDMVFLGLVGIIDPPRPEAIEAIKACHTAGIRVKMITGDHAGTAKAIGREMGIGDGNHAVTGTELEKASDEELRRLAHDYDVFARTSPEHKLRLVKALQANGEVVAMTGDGVNDAPALKRADVGVAMGIKGTEATKEAAEIVLADDNFTSIERAVEEGRTIYDNLRKAILFILPTNGAQSLVILAASCSVWCCR